MIWMLLSGIILWKETSLPKSLLSIFNPPSTAQNWCKLIWAKHIPPSRFFIFWRLVHNKLLTYDNLRRKECVIVSICCFSLNAYETTKHITFSTWFLICPVFIFYFLKFTLCSENIIWLHFDIYNPKSDETQKWFCNWYQRYVLTIIQSQHKLQSNCRDCMNGQQWSWYHKPLKT